MDTSHEAYQSILPDAATLRRGALAVLQRLGPRTADEVAKEMRESVLSIRPRITELYKEGKIIRTGETRTNRSGRRANVWQLRTPRAA